MVDSSAASTSAGSPQVTKSEGDMQSYIDKVKASHDPDNGRFDIISLFHIVEDTFMECESDFDETKAAKNTAWELHEITPEKKSKVLESLSSIINKLFWEVSYNAVRADVHDASVSLLGSLSGYTWDCKLVLIMLAFALSYGEFRWLMTQVESSDPIAKSMAILNQMPSIKEQAKDVLKRTFSALDTLIKAMRDFTKSVVEAAEMITYEGKLFVSTPLDDLFPPAIFLTVTSVLTCSAVIAVLPSPLPYKDEKLNNLTKKLSDEHESLTKQIKTCRKEIDKKKEKILSSIKPDSSNVKTSPSDNMMLLRTLIYFKEDIPPLYLDNIGKPIDELKDKVVLLLISGLNLSFIDLFVLKRIYDVKKPEYVMVWIPAIDDIGKWDKHEEEKFKELRDNMPWYSVRHPRLVEKVGTEFIKKEWQFKQRPILAVIDHDGKVLSPNALHMIWIWGFKAFPFSTATEEFLWKDEKWNLRLLFDGISYDIFQWASKAKYIFMHGGDNIEWIRRFTASARKVAEEAQIQIEMVYLGKSYGREKIDRVVNTIFEEKLGHRWNGLVTWLFWKRLRSMVHSRAQLCKINADDKIRELKMLLSHDTYGGWALLSKGDEIVVCGHSTTALRTLEEFDQWKNQVSDGNFHQPFKNHFDNLRPGTQDEPCSRLEFPDSIGNIHEDFRCAYCSKRMQKRIAFRCCHDSGSADVYANKTEHRNFEL